MTSETSYLILGLGNPGREYRDSRHNVGFMFIDRLIIRLNARGMKVQSKAIVTDAMYQDRKLILAKPQTYMNLSGQSVQGLVHFYKIPLTNLMVLSDDLDIPFGTIRIRAAGGPGGQRRPRALRPRRRATWIPWLYLEARDSGSPSIHRAGPFHAKDAKGAKGNRQKTTKYQIPPNLAQNTKFSLR